MYGVRTRRGFRGLSAYPTDPYYDPTRPSWLPYWIDDPTESQAKLAYYASGVGINVGATATQIANPASVYPPPPAPAVPPAPEGTAVPSSAEQAAALPGQLIAQGEQQTQQQNQQFFQNLAQSLGDSGSGSLGGLSTGTLIALGLAAGIGLLLVTSLGGRRRR